MKLLSTSFTYLLLLLSTFAIAQPDTTAKDSVIRAWTFSGQNSLGFSQIALSNWSAGGENSYTLNASVNLNATRSWGKNIWQNSLNIGYGIQQLEHQGTKKLNDLLIVNTQYGYKASGKWFYTGRVNLETQLTKGYDYNVTPKKFTSTWFAPAYILASVGLEFRSTNKVVTVLFSPATAKYTIVDNDYLSSIGAFGVATGNAYRSEFGGAIITMYKKAEIIKNVNVDSILGLFSNYSDKPNNIDVSWQLLVVMKVNKLLSTIFSTHLLYDDNVIGEVQLKEMLTVGLSYNF